MSDKISGVFVAEDCDLCRPSDTFPCGKCGDKGYIQKKISIEEFYWLLKNRGNKERIRVNEAYENRKKP